MREQKVCDVREYLLLAFLCGVISCQTATHIQTQALQHENIVAWRQLCFLPQIRTTIKPDTCKSRVSNLCVCLLPPQATLQPRLNSSFTSSHANPPPFPHNIQYTAQNKHAHPHWHRRQEALEDGRSPGLSGGACTLRDSHCAHAYM